MRDTYDVIVIGAGTAGENAAWYARDNGLHVALIERELVGGQCTYWACMPSKALLRPPEVLAAARRVPGAASAVTGPVDVEATLRSRDAFINHLDDEHQVQWVEGVGVDLVRGTGRLSGPRTVEVADGQGQTRTLHARRAVVIATGTSAAVPPIDGLDEIEWWDNRQVTTTSTIPDRLLVLGGGVVGSEMAQAARRLGAGEVTIVEMLDRLIAVEEPFVGDRLRAAFEQEGITVVTAVRAVKATRADDGRPVTLELEDGRRLEGDELLVATGRRPNTADLGLETVGLSPGKSIAVDDTLRAVGVEGGWLYAVGDVNGRALLTHQGKYQARIAGDVIAGKERAAWADHTAVPRVAFTDPQVAAVGRTEQQARDAGVDVRTLTVDLGSVAGAALLGQDVSGVAHLVVDNATDTIAGATFVGPGVGELLHAATVAIVGGVTLGELWDAVPSFPTLSEVWLRLLEADRGIG
jgi:pyruvate/2-oxoglutarate dehydrogenase complex dihydrolipoamide dehydrogenase (E3) component